MSTIFQAFKAQYNPYLYPGIVDFSQPSFWIAAGSICFNPLFWNTVAQNEYRNKTLTKVVGGNPYYGCYVLAVTIFSLGIIRDHFYNQALASQPASPFLVAYAPVLKPLAAGLFALGNVLVLSSMWALGVTGTYLGDYFGILMDEMVTGFPFNFVSDPMYWGSSCSFVAVALWFAKPAGLILSALVVVVYAIALRYEGPFTSNIYARAAREKTKKDTVAKLQAVEGPASGLRSRQSTSRS